MKNFISNRRIARTFCALNLVTLITASSAWASVVWDLNPNNLNAPAGSPTVTFTSSGSEITARGYDNTGATGTPHELYFKNIDLIGGAIEHGLGLTNISDNELQTTAGVPANFIQLDLRSIISMGYTGFEIKVGSVQSGESFQLFGSTTQGVLGTSLGVYGSTFDNQFVSVVGFPPLQFLSVTSASGDVLPVAFQATITPVPEMSALLPIVGLLLAIGMVEMLRRRRSARLLA